VNATAAIFLTVLLALSAATAADARSAVGVSEYSQAGTEGTASAGASVTYTHSTGGGHSSPVGSGPSTLTGSEAGASAPISSGEPAGASTGNQTTCVAAHESEVSPCYGVLPAAPEARRTPPRPGSAPAPVNPAAIAATLSNRLILVAGRITASPSTHTDGLTGAASWFWLEPPPSPQTLSVSLGGEHITVSAGAASVRWSFGDDSQRLAGPGVPYRPGTAPAGAVLHTYQTRCLPGDQGHDPNVLPSCGSDGYTVEATVQWSISYTASGPVGGGGALPSRSTAASIAYPVGEARAFLTTAGGAG
jgi:hypothetical protein